MDALDNPDNHTALNQTSIIPITSSGKPIEYDGNPAHLAGVLHELEQFLIRSKHFEPLSKARDRIEQKGESRWQNVLGESVDFRIEISRDILCVVANDAL